jgi:BolA protein
MNMRETIEQQLSSAFNPLHLDVVDESHMHNVPAGAQSHFNVFVVAETFSGQRLVARHQAVYRALAEQMAGSVHALALKTLSPDEWAAAGGGGGVVSPPCLGGSSGET